MIKWLGEAGQISRTGILEELPWMILMAVSSSGEFLTGEEKGLSNHQHFPGTVAFLSKL